MTAAATKPSRQRRWWLALAWALIVVPVLALLPYASSGTEVVKLRNAVLLQGELDGDFDWAAPPSPQPARQREPMAADVYFAELVQRLKLAEMQDDWARALAISEHLLASQPVLLGGGVQADLRSTHAAIVEQGTGYCADYVRVFMAIASAAGMQVRGWAFSFDGFGGHGHIFVELWNRQAQRWQLLDLFNNARFDAGGAGPLSAFEFRRVLAREPQQLQMSRLTARARPGYVEPAKAIDYYKLGLDEWYLFGEPSVLDTESSASFRALLPISYALAQVGSVAQGSHPQIRPLRTANNSARIEALRRLRLQLWLTAASVVLGLLLLCALAASRHPAGKRHGH